jgi:hypothetical protein
MISEFEAGELTGVLVGGGFVAVCLLWIKYAPILLGFDDKKSSAEENHRPAAKKSFTALVDGMSP